MTGSARANVQTRAPGSTLHLVWDEYVPHPGWYRVSFQQNGDTFEVPPASTGASGTGGTNNFPTEDLTGKTDLATGSLIIADRIQHPALSLDVTLPNVECNNCTLQLIQMMTEGSYGSGSIYFACVDLVLSASAPAPDAGTGTGPGPAPGGGAPDAGTGNGGANNGGTVTGGCGVDGGSSVVLALALLGLLKRRSVRLAP